MVGPPPPASWLWGCGPCPQPATLPQPRLFWPTAQKQSAGSESGSPIQSAHPDEDPAGLPRVRGWGGGSKDLFLLGDSRSPSAGCLPSSRLGFCGPKEAGPPPRCAALSAEQWGSEHIPAQWVPTCGLCLCPAAGGLASHSRAQRGGGHRACLGRLGEAFSVGLPSSRGSWGVLPRTEPQEGCGEGPGQAHVAASGQAGGQGLSHCSSVPRGWPPQPRLQPQPLCRREPRGPA